MIWPPQKIDFKIHTNSHQSQGLPVVPQLSLTSPHGTEQHDFEPPGAVPQVLKVVMLMMEDHSNCHYHFVSFYLLHHYY